MSLSKPHFWSLCWRHLDDLHDLTRWPAGDLNLCCAVLNVGENGWDLNWLQFEGYTSDPTAPPSKYFQMQKRIDALSLTRRLHMASASKRRISFASGCNQRFDGLWRYPKLRREAIAHRCAKPITTLATSIWLDPKLCQDFPPFTYSWRIRSRLACLVKIKMSGSQHFASVGC